MNPFEECPRFSHCNANHCPLDPNKHKRIRLKGEDRCSLGKKRRMLIASKYPDLLPQHGLWQREITAQKKWDELPEEQKQAKIETLKYYKNKHLSKK